MKRHLALAILAATSSVLVGVTLTLAVNTSSLSLSATIAEQTHRRVFVLDKGTAWNGLGIYCWGNNTEALLTTKVASIDDGDLYFVDIGLHDIAGGGFLFVDADYVEGGEVHWNGNAMQSIAAPELPEWGNADIYSLTENGSNKADCTLEGGIELNAQSSAALLRYYTSCAKDLSGTSSSSYLSDILAYPQLQADFQIEKHLNEKAHAIGG